MSATAAAWSPYPKASRMKTGTPILSKLMETGRDAHGNVQLSGTGALGEQLAKQIKEKLGIKRVVSDTLGYLQRSFMGCVSDVDQHEAREVGEKAAQFAIWHNVDGSITIHRTGYYSVDYKISALKHSRENQADARRVYQCQGE